MIESNCYKQYAMNYSSPQYNFQRYTGSDRGGPRRTDSITLLKSGIIYLSQGFVHPSLLVCSRVLWVVASAGLSAAILRPLFGTSMTGTFSYGTLHNNYSS